MKNKNQKGFTLLLAALVASITLALGAAIFSITVKQIELSGIGRDSQFAFYAADTLAECALYWDVRQNIFATSTVPGPGVISVKCNGTTIPVDVTNDTQVTSNGTCDFTPTGPVGSDCGGSDATHFVVPSNFTSMTVTVTGGGGGGGGGAKCNNPGSGSGGNGVAGTAAVFDSSGSYGQAVFASQGGAGARGPNNCLTNGADGSLGNATGGDTSTVGGAGNGGIGGPPDNGVGSLGTGGSGGAGGLSIKTYDPTTLTGSTVDLSVGAYGPCQGGKGCGGAGGGTPVAGSPGSNGGAPNIHIVWTGGTPVWHQTIFTFQDDLNNDCTHTTLTKTLDTGAIRTLVHTDGLNVPCVSSLIDPRALQRSVEISY